MYKRVMCCRVPKIVISIIGAVAITLYITTSHQPTNLHVNEKSTISWEMNTTLTNSTKTILIWNGLRRFELDVFGEGREPFVQRNCPINDCLLTRNKSIANLEDFDAIIFNVPTFARLNFPQDTKRSSKQRYIFFSQESPVYVGEDPSHFDNFFNWTMSYQRNSDIVYDYGRIVALPTAPKSESEIAERIAESGRGVNRAEGKMKMVAWFCSHCYTHSRREKYVNLLRKYINVDMYGGCYMKQCQLNETSYLSDDSCYEMLDHNYRFYLSFENSLCTDYVTEKFFNILQYNVIPIVMGGVDYSTIAPPHSYIDALQYTPRQLAEYLLLLSTNETLYNEYFWWKPYYKIELRYPVSETRALCQLCEKLHRNQTVSIYKDLRPHWGMEAQCHKPLLKGVRFFFGYL